MIDEGALFEVQVDAQDLEHGAEQRPEQSLQAESEVVRAC